MYRRQFTFEAILIFAFSNAMLFCELYSARMKHRNRMLKEIINSINIELDPTIVPDGQMVIYHTNKIKYTSITDSMFDVSINCGMIIRKEKHKVDEDGYEMISNVALLTHDIEAGNFTLSGLKYIGGVYKLSKNTISNQWIEFWRPKYLTVIGQKRGDKIIQFTKSGIRIGAAIERYADSNTIHSILSEKDAMTTYITWALRIILLIGILNANINGGLIGCTPYFVILAEAVLIQPIFNDGYFMSDSLWVLYFYSTIISMSSFFTSHLYPLNVDNCKSLITCHLLVAVVEYIWLGIQILGTVCLRLGLV
ncbi:hypothetical protein TVAG_028680 [Trichomonas vaginalis G3]|uniref:Uncharacterized protein n=1 Tax=Trichomonas vaginalis (strain ATCC PRA-98 / G3) TaxID=412133 RepID=A2E0B5_TRIV3|nr:transmembrane protein 43 family [Trichomonas vaginalis G3]EAY13915.1 hypothetical protein TVAG_028680 [Trichomonas vaginalis G3]KAI5520901.1 transmembrane protein 43 family [Trichomonas vaginalis G3]|eukprot:XP_001326138.1 hypothetical protein [Trichomonas vaginalis G3]